MTRLGAWADRQIAKVDATLAMVVGRLVDVYCSMTGRSNLHFALVAILASVPPELFRQTLSGWSGFDVAWAIVGLYGVEAIVRDLREADRSQGSGALHMGVLPTFLYRYRGALVVVLLTVVLGGQDGVVGRLATAATRLMLVLAAYAIGHPNRGGKSVVARLRERLASVSFGGGRLAPA